jgi:NADPH-dependent curcumin reductase CurA
MKKNTQWLLARYPKGPFTPRELEWRESPLQPIQEGMVRVKTKLLSLDPTNRVWMTDKDTYMPGLKIGDVMRGICIGTVEESRHSSFKQGAVVQGLWGWQSHYTTTGDDLALLPDLPPALPLTAHFGLLGHIGIAAHYGIMQIGKPKPGETVLVSAASGAVGSLAGQIARLCGARVVGIAGSDEKCRKIQEELQFDAAINYKKTPMKEGLERCCPNGVDVYFDNVGGWILDAALGAMNNYGRVIFSGMITEYNKEQPETRLSNVVNIVTKRLLLKGFISLDHMDYAAKAYSDLVSWSQQKKIRYQVDVRNGLENAPAALRSLFDGSNNGKLIIEVA